MQVKDLPDTLQFISDSQDTEAVKKDFGAEFDSFFVEIGDGDYLIVYGMYGIIPYLNKHVYKIV